MFEKKTKIICTIGPASWDEETIEKMVLAGMDIARLNFSHGAHQEKNEQIEKIRKISRKLKKRLAVMADLQGPKIRLGRIDGEAEEDTGDPKIFLKTGQIIKLSTNPKDDELSIQYDLSPFMKVGQKILINDGLVEGKVIGIIGKTLKIEVLNDGFISSNKGVNVPETLLPEASLTAKDIIDAEFALKNGCEYLAISFVQTIQDIEKGRKLIKKYNPKTKLVIKLEKPQAIKNLENIIKATDVVMIARGDLAIETKASEVPLLQLEIIRLSRQYQKPVIVATQMLESMIEHARPTRAEVSDVANAVLSEVDAVTLSAESANGKYPVETVHVMNDIIHTIEKNPTYRHYIKVNWEQITRESLTLNAIVSAASALSYRAGAKLIVVATSTGQTAQLISSFRPTSSILAVSYNQYVANQLALVWGVESIVIEKMDDADEFAKKIIHQVKNLHILKPGDKFVLVVGTHVGKSGDIDTVRLVTF
ncbi:pyruvate kinase [Candidatus Daviesbacteria bacterium]|nr:pyruvate kinase [Candidatus Daviesbacteria bacterium]